MEEEEEKLTDLVASKMKMVESSKGKVYRLLKDRVNITSNQRILRLQNLLVILCQAKRR